MSTSKKVGKAGFYLLSRKLWGGLLNVFVMALLARTLDKSDFGLIVLSTVLIEFVKVFAVSGISDYIVFSKSQKIKTEINSVFWLTLTLIGVVSVLVILLEPFWSKFYDEPRLKELIFIALVPFVFNTLSSIPNAIFRKNLDYGFATKVQTINESLIKVSQVGLAFSGFGVFSLIVPSAFFSITQAVAFFWKAKINLSFKIDFRIWKTVIAYTKNIIGAEIITKFLNEGDKVIIGKVFGNEILGVYDIAFRLGNIINSQLVPIITNISMPLFSLNSENLAVTKKYFFDFTKFLSNSFLPIYVALFFLAEFLILTLYGSQWIDAILPFKIFISIAALRSLSSPAAALYNALGKPKVGFVFTSIFTPIHLLLVYLTAVNSSFFYVLVVIAMSRNIGSIAHFFVLSKMLSYRIKDLVNNLNSVFGAILIGGAGVYLLNSFRDFHSIINTLSFCLIYLTLMLTLFRKDFFVYLNSIKKILPFKF